MEPTVVPTKTGGSYPSRAVVVGTGLMAPGIAAALARARIAVVLTGRNESKSSAAAERARQLASQESDSIQAQPLAAPAFADAGLVVETVSEDLDIKREILSRVESWCSPRAVLATNTSSLRLRDIAAALARPDNLGGLHFLNPAHLTSLVEVVAPRGVAPRVAETLQAVSIAMGKIPILVQRDIPGFVWNRLQAAMIRECLFLIEEGVTDVASVDLAVAEGLAPRWLAVGPLGTVDLGGIATFGAMTSRLFPELSNAETPTGPLAGKDAEFYGWDEQTRGQVADLRDRAVRWGVKLGQRRRQLLATKQTET